MDSFKVAIAGDRQAGIRFDEFPDAAYAGLKQEIEGITAELFALTRGLIPVRTGRLLSQERMRVFADPHHIKGEVDIAGQKGSQDFAKAGSLEFGAHNSRGPTKAHTMRLDHAWDQKLASPLNVMVSAYTRTPNIEEHRFERGPLAEMQPVIAARLNAAVEKAVAGANA